MKPTEQFFLVRPFNALYKEKSGHSNESYEYFPLEDGYFLEYMIKLKRSMVHLDDTFLLFTNSN